MLRKIVSIVSPVMLAVSAILIVGAPGAAATASTDSSLDIASSVVKGVALPTATAYNCIDCSGPSLGQNRSTLTLTPAEAASTIATTTFVATDAGATVKVLKMASVTLPFNDTSFTNAPAWNQTSAIYHNEIILVRVTAADGFTKSYYGWSVSAASSDATFSAAQVKGVSVTSLGTPNTNIASVVAGAVTITPEQAASTQLITNATKTVNSNFPYQRKKFAAGSNPTTNDYTGAGNYSTGAITDGDIIIYKNFAEDGSTYLWYKFVVTVSAAQQQQSNNSSSSSNSAAIAAAAEAQRQAAVAAAKSELVSTLKAGGPITAASLNAADIAVASAKAADRVIAKVAALPEAKRTDLAAIAAIVKTENFVDKVSTPATQITVTTRDLVIQELLTADYKYKTSIVKAILSKEASSLDTIEKIQAVVKAELAAIDVRKARIAAVQARVLTYYKK